MLKSYFTIAWRNIRRNKVSSVINILGLSFGICASLIIYLITGFELSYDRFHPEKERIYRIVGSHTDNQGKKDEIGVVIPALPLALRRELTGFEKVAEFHNYYARVTIPLGSGEPKRFDAAKRGEEASPIVVVEPQYFDIFQYQWLQGNPCLALKDPFKVVLSESEAYKYFGKEPLENIVGKEIFYKDVYLDDSLQLTVSGIVKDWNKNTDLVFKDFISFATIGHSFLKREINMDGWGNWSPAAQGFVKLAKGVTPAQVEKQFPKFLAAHIPPTPGHTFALNLQPLSDIHFNSNYRDDYTKPAHLPTLYALIGIAAFILVIAAINFINLSTAQSLYRAKEVGVRKVLGSSKNDLRLQFLLETFIVTFIAVIFSVVLCSRLPEFFPTLVPKGVGTQIGDPATLLFLASITIITVLLAGFYPAKVLSSYLPALILKGRGTGKTGQNNWLRKGLIVFQFTISLVFIICTLVIGNQVRFIQNKDLGFQKDAIISFRTAWNEPVDQVAVFAEKLRRLAAVKKVSIDMETPAAERHANTYIVRVDAPEFKAPASYEMCDENYIPLFGLQIVGGRNINHSDTVGEFLVNETCMAALGLKSPADAVGKTVQTGMNELKGTIVGVVKDFNSKSLHEHIQPFFISSDKSMERAVSVKLTIPDGDVARFNGTIAEIGKIWKGLYPADKFEYSFFDETIARLYATEQKTAQLMNTAMLIAIFISCMGLFGLATFTAQQRTKEIGIRKVLGARVSGIVSMLSKDFVVLVFIALLVASPVAWYFMQRWLSDFAYRVTISGWTFVFAGLAAILIALATTSYHAVKAALANPVESLRSE